MATVLDNSLKDANKHFKEISSDVVKSVNSEGIRAAFILHRKGKDTNRKYTSY